MPVDPDPLAFRMPADPEAPRIPADPEAPRIPADPDRPAFRIPADPPRFRPADPARTPGPADPARTPGPADPARTPGPADPARTPGPADPAPARQAAVPPEPVPFWWPATPGSGPTTLPVPSNWAAPDVGGRRPAPVPGGAGPPLAGPLTGPSAPGDVTGPGVDTTPDEAPAPDGPRARRFGRRRPRPAPAPDAPAATAPSDGATTGGPTALTPSRAPADPADDSTGHAADSTEAVPDDSAGDPGDGPGGGPSGGRGRIGAAAGLRPRAAVRWQVGGVHVVQLVTAEVAALLVLLTAGRGPAPTAAGAVVAAILLALTGVRRHDRWLVQWAAARLRWRQRSRRVPDPVPLPPELVVDAVRGRRGIEIGVVQDGDGWVVALDVAVRSGADGATELPLRPLAAVLEAPDLPVSEAQVVLRIAPARSTPAENPDGVVLAVAGIAVWVTVRIDAAEVEALVGDRGTAGGSLGVAVRRCVDRLLAALSGAGLRATPLDVDGLQEAVRLTGALDAVAGPDEGAGRPPAAEDWTGYREAGRIHGTSVVTGWPAAGPAALVAAATAVPFATTVLALHLARRRGGRPVLRGAVRLSTAGEGDAERAATALADAAAARGLRLRPATGHELAGLRATLPLARPWTLPAARPLRADRDPLTLPLPEAGVPLGVGSRGTPVLLPLLRDRPVRVGVLGTGPAAALLVDGLLAADARPRLVGLHPADWATLRHGRGGGADPAADDLRADGGRLPGLIVAGPAAAGTPGPDSGSWQVTVVVHPLPTPDEVAAMRAFDVLVLHRLPPELARAVRRFDGIDARAAERLSQLPPGLVAVVADGRGRFADLTAELGRTV